MAESNGRSQTLMSDDLTKLCNALAQIARAGREVERALDSIIDRKEHEVAHTMLRMEINDLQAIQARCFWNGDD